MEEEEEEMLKTYPEVKAYVGHFGVVFTNPEFWYATSGPDKANRF